ncbi:MAG: polyphenol oxidase family protein [Myxococcota bacterium]
MTLALFHAKKLAELPHVVHGFTHRQGGVSTKHYESLNLAQRPDEDSKNVTANRHRVLEHLGRSDAELVCLKQVHGDTIVQVSREAGRSIEADGVWTQDPKAAIGVLVADCVPMLLAARSKNSIAAVHAGWRGTPTRISGSHGRASRICGHCAHRPCCRHWPGNWSLLFEIGEEISDALREAFPDIRLRFNHEKTAKRWLIYQLNRTALRDAGVPDENIEILTHCTACDKRFFPIMT